MREVILATGLLLAGCGSGTETSMDSVPVVGEPAPPAVGAMPTMETPSTAQTDLSTEASSSSTEIAAPESPPVQAPSEAEVESTPEVTPPESDPPMIDVEPEPETPDESEPMNEAVPDMNMDPDVNEADPEPETLDEPTETDPEDVVDEPPTAAPLSFATDIWPLWSMDRDPVFVYRGAGSYSGCADVGVCHGGETPGAQLSMADAETAYAQMIDTPSVSTLCAGTQRVVVGDPDNSCLILFYVGRLGKDDLDWVDDAEIELMREWIRQGALP